MQALGKMGRYLSGLKDNVSLQLSSDRVSTNDDNFDNVRRFDYDQDEESDEENDFASNPKSRSIFGLGGFLSQTKISSGNPNKAEYYAQVSTDADDINNALGSHQISQYQSYQSEGGSGGGGGFGGFGAEESSYSSSSNRKDSDDWGSWGNNDQGSSSSKQKASAAKYQTDGDDKLIDLVGPSKCDDASSSKSKKASTTSKSNDGGWSNSWEDDAWETLK